MLQEILNEFRQYLTPSAFSVVQWKKLIWESPRLTKETFQIGKPTSFPDGISIGIGHNQLSPEAFTHENRRLIGKKIVELYFHQIFRSNTVFLDIGPDSFTTTGTSLFWNPRAWSWKPEVNFIQSLRNIYLGYYHSDEEKLSASIIALGLAQSPAGVDQMKELFFKHFGDVNDDEVELSLENFRNSFGNMFRYLIENKITLDAQFTYLGFYLFRLYQSLESFNLRLPIKEVFLSTSQLGIK